MTKPIIYNYHTYTAISDKQIAVSKENNVYILQLEKPLQEGDLIQIVPLVDDLLSKGVVSLRINQ